MKQILILMSVFCLTCITTSAQHKLIGRVIDLETKKPIEKVKVNIDGKSFATQTNHLGYFELVVDSSDVLIFEKDFYKTGRLNVPKSSRLNVAIEKRKQTVYDGNFDSFYMYVAEKIRYPITAQKYGTTGLVLVSFKINQKGDMFDITKLKGLGNGCSSSVIQALKRLPNKWETADTTALFILPVEFKKNKDSQIKKIDRQFLEGIVLNELMIVGYY